MVYLIQMNNVMMAVKIIKFVHLGTTQVVAIATTNVKQPY